MDWTFDANPRGSAQPNLLEEYESGKVDYGSAPTLVQQVSPPAGSTQGTGINFAVGSGGGRGLKIRSVVPGGPASRAVPHPEDKHLFPQGADILQSGDLLYRVDGTDVFDLDASAIAPLLRGPSGTAVEITGPC